MKPRATPPPRCGWCPRPAVFRVRYGTRALARIFACELHIAKARNLPEVSSVCEVRP
jgi:hypothetical protein